MHPLLLPPLNFRTKPRHSAHRSSQLGRQTPCAELSAAGCGSRKILAGLEEARQPCSLKLLGPGIEAGGNVLRAHQVCPLDEPAPAACLTSKLGFLTLRAPDWMHPWNEG